MRKNLWKLIDTVSDMMDLQDAMHFIETWADDNGWSVAETRTHIDDCPACHKVYATLTRGTDIAMIPINQDPDPPGTSYGGLGGYSDNVTVIGDNPALKPQRELVLPKVPTSMRSAVADKDLVIVAQVSAYGEASVISIDDDGFSSYVSKRAKTMIETTSWSPARDSRGRPQSGLVRIIFRW